MSDSPDPQTWIFPPLGAAVLPHDVSASFGPISRGDKIKFQWAPASSTPEVAFTCADTGGSAFIASSGSTSPSTYTFDQNIENGTSHVCWFFFPGTKLGNTLTFEYNNAASDSSTLWQANSQIAQALSGGSNSAATTILSTVTETKTVRVNTDIGNAAPAAATTIVSIETVTQVPHTLLTTIANPSTTFVSTSVELIAQNTVSPGSAAASTSTSTSTSTTGTSNASVGYSTSSAGGISPGVAAGIAAAAVVALALVLLAMWTFLRRRSARNGYIQGTPQTPGLLGTADTRAAGTGPVLVPSTFKYQPPMEVQGQSLVQGYYSPVSGAAEAGSKERTRRTIHEMAGGA